MKFPLAFWKPAGGGYDPAVLSLTGWWRTDFGGSPWVGVASAGSSGSRNLTEGLDVPGIVAVNGRNSAAFDGVNDKLANGTAWSTLFTASAGSIACVFYAVSAAAAGLVYDDPALLVDNTSGFNGLHFSSSGVRAYVDDGGTKSVNAACGTGAWHLAQMKWDGTNLKVRVDSGAWQSVACGNASNLTGTLAIGRNYTATQWFEGNIAEIMTAPSTISDATFNDIKSYVNSRYALAL